MRRLLLMILLVMIASSCLAQKSGLKCTEKKNCKAAKGVCQSSTTPCSGEIIKRGCIGKDRNNCICCAGFEAVSQCFGNGKENSVLWNKMASAETAITSIIDEGNNVTRELQKRINHLEKKLDIILHLVNMTMTPPTTAAPSTTTAPPCPTTTKAPPCPVCPSTTTASPTTTAPPGCPEDFVMSSGSKQCFKLFTDEILIWEEAVSKCKTEGLVLAHPSDAVALALYKDLIDKYGDGEYAWLDARGDGSKYMWQREMTELRSDNPLWWPGESQNVGTANCLVQSVHKSNWLVYPTRPYLSMPCASRKHVLCEVNVE